MNTFIKYWSYLVENENKEISFETFLEKKKSNLFEASKKWPEDYLKQAKNLIMNSPLGKSSWYLENYIDTDLIDNFKNRFDTLAHKGSFALGFFPTIIKWFIEYSGSDFNKYQEFIEGKLDKIIGILNFILSQKDDEVSQFHGISKEKDKDGNPLILKFKKLKDMNWSNFEKEVFQKYSDQISNSVELKNDNESSDYEIVPIYSYDELHDKFGGDKTGYEGRSEWCHTNGKSTYDSTSWTDGGKYMFIVFAKKGWENITPPDPGTTNAFDNYGTSLIACLFDTNSKKLLHSTLRWNHVIDPAATKVGASVDNAFLNENDLMNTVGIDLSKDLDEYFAKFREINRAKFVTIGGKDFEIEEDGNFYCDNSELTSLVGAPQEVSGDFYCYKNELTSLEGAPQKVGRNFICFTNKLSSLEGAPREIGKHFDCSSNKLTSLKCTTQKIGGNFVCYNNKLTSLEGAPQEVGGNFDCYDNKLTSLKGCPQKVGRDFSCAINKLTSLKGTPQKINGNFYCDNNKLTSLEGAPEKVDGNVFCHNNSLTSLEGAPKEIGENFYCTGNVDLPEYKIKAYRAYLKLSDSEKAPLTKDGHYYPTEEWENKFN